MSDLDKEDCVANRKEEPNQLEAVHLHRVLNSRKFGGILLLQLKYINKCTGGHVTTDN